MSETIAEFMDRQKRKVARFGRRAEAAAHEAYGNAIRAGQDLALNSPGDVMRHGVDLLQENADRAAAAVSNTARQGKRLVDEVVERAGQNSAARTAAVHVARKVGNAAGVVRGGVHAVEGLLDAANVVGRVANPFDGLKGPPHESARAQVVRNAVKAGGAAVDYVQKGLADPRSVVRDVNEAAQEWRRDLDPAATPEAPTFGGELQRNFDIGENQGDLAFNLGSLWFGGPAAKSVKGFVGASNIGNTEKYLAQGFGPKAAARLAEPYPASGMGSHFIPRRTKLPRWLGGGPLPKSYMDGPFNKLVPPESSIGDLYELHYGVDPRFHGTRAGGERWSGRDLGLKRYGPLGQVWFGSPAPLKARVGGLGMAAGNGFYDTENGETGW